MCLELPSLQDMSTVRTIQEQALVMLSEYAMATVQSQQPSSNPIVRASFCGKLRFAKLLLLIPSLWSLSPQTVEKLFLANTLGTKPVQQLLRDMLRSL